MSNKLTENVTETDLNQAFKRLSECKEWNKERKWLIKNGIEVKRLEEEHKFQMTILQLA